eukprot:scaffold18049_cov117-Skeletonema_menzelii.AAC.2
MSSYPPKRQIFKHRSPSEGNSSNADESGSINDSQMATRDEHSENSDGTDRASNHGNAASRPNHHNYNNQSYTMNLPPRLPVPTTVVAIETGMESSSSPSTINTVTPTNTTVSFAGASNTKLTAEALQRNDQEFQQQLHQLQEMETTQQLLFAKQTTSITDNTSNHATATSSNIDGDRNNNSENIFGIVEVSSNLSRSSSESGMKNALYKHQQQQIREQRQQQLLQQQQQNSSLLEDGSLSNSRHSVSEYHLPFGSNEDGVSSLGSLEPRQLGLGEDMVLYPPTSVMDVEGEGNGGGKGGVDAAMDAAVDAAAETARVEADIAFSRLGTLPSSNAGGGVSSAEGVSGIGMMVKNELSSAALDVIVTTVTSSDTAPKTNLSSAKSSGGDVDSEQQQQPNNNGEGRSPSAFPFHQNPSDLPQRSPTKIPATVTAVMPGTLLPMGSAVIERGAIDPASIKPPAPPLSPMGPVLASSPMPPSAIRRLREDVTSQSPSVHRLNNNPRKTTFQEQPITLTRTSSNGSSTTNATSASVATRIRLGLCAMDKKARSKPMSEILKRLDQTTFEPVFFGDALILNEPVESWPICDVLIAFYSNGYPLEKAEQYVALRRPYLINDLRMQRTLMDRRLVYDLLEESGIDVPRHVFMSRDGYVSTGTGDGPRKNADDEGGSSICREEPEIEEHDDHIEVNGVTINKPFVEKPVDADDHNIAIYYPSSAGGGCKKLFRKVGDRSSEFYPEINEIRRDGSYIYEEFIETQGTDVKMYTVGPDYGHAEARKSPTVDGKVERNPDGKEVRFPVILTLREKEIARRIVLRFKQQVCGFDILRIQEGDSLVSYVCDVNGWSFVKNSRKYYDDCAQILTEHMLALLKPKSLVSFSALAPLLTTVDDTKSRKKRNHHGHHRGASIADRVKSMLMGASNSSQNDTDDNEKDEENDKVTDLQTSDGVGEVREEPVDFTPIRDLPDQLSTEPVPNSSIVPSGSSSLADPDDASLPGAKEDGPTSHEEELRCVITIIRHGDRTPKQKLKYVTDQERMLGYFHGHTKKVKKDLKIKAKKNMVEFLGMVKALIEDLEADGPGKNLELMARARHIRDILERWQFSGLNRKLQMKPQAWESVETPDGMKSKCSELQLIVKWGGDLTKLGEKQATQLGNRLRNELYPSNKGGGILRLHSTFRHDLKIKTSDEGRVMKTAAAFAKGMLELEGDLPPILVSLVHKEKDSQHMLDPSGHKDVKADLEKCKEKINANMQRDVDYDKMTKEERESLVGPERLLSLHRALKEVGNPRKTLIAIHSTIGQLVDQLDDMLGALLSGDEEVNEGGAGLKGKEGQEGALSGIKLYKGETLLELTERWKLLQNKLYDDESETFDLSRVPDVHDNVRFDMLHNPHLGLTETLQKLYDLAKSMADCVVPQEYGITVQEKRDIGAKMCHSLLEKIK